MAKARWGHILMPSERFKIRVLVKESCFLEMCGEDIACREQGLWAGSEAKGRKCVGG